MSRRIRDIPYGPGDRQIGDLLLPAGPAEGPPVLLIHGGSWGGMSKEAVESIAESFQANGHAVYSINYRLIPGSPWPACGDDCLAAGHFLLNGGLAENGLPAPADLLVCGASAGGHLAMMTGLRLPRERVRGILSLAGPSRWDPRDDTEDSVVRKPGLIEAFFGGPVEIGSPQVKAASPIDCVPKNPPPLICIHSTNDRLVPPSHSEAAATAWQAAGAPAGVRTFAGPGPYHGFWAREGEEWRELVPEFETLLTGALKDLRGSRPLAFTEPLG